MRLIALLLLLLTAAADYSPLPPLSAMPAPAASGRVAVGDADIWYASYGSGPPVILLHGGLANSDYWAGEIATLAAAHRVIVIDSRGHGRSTLGSGPLGYERMAADVIAVMDRLRLRRAALVGWSDGGIVALILAMRRPERVTGVWALAANMDPSGALPNDPARPRFVGYVARAATEYRAGSPTPAGWPAFRAAVSRMWRTEPRYTAADLARIHVPVTIAIGERDEVIGRAHSAYLARTIPGARLVVLPRVSHFAILQDPALVSAAILRFLDARAAIGG